MRTGGWGIYIIVNVRIYFFLNERLVHELLAIILPDYTPENESRLPKSLEKFPQSKSK